eukprot:5710830-Pleurochrysis_carterae.AAC.1
MQVICTHLYTRPSSDEHARTQVWTVNQSSLAKARVYRRTTNVRARAQASRMYASREYAHALTCRHRTDCTVLGAKGRTRCKRSGCPHRCCDQHIVQVKQLGLCVSICLCARLLCVVRSPRRDEEKKLERDRAMLFEDPRAKLPPSWVAAATGESEGRAALGRRGAADSSVRFGRSLLLLSLRLFPFLFDLLLA